MPMRILSKRLTSAMIYRPRAAPAINAKRSPDRIASLLNAQCWVQMLCGRQSARTITLPLFGRDFNIRKAPSSFFSREQTFTDDKLTTRENEEGVWGWSDATSQTT